MLFMLSSRTLTELKVMWIFVLVEIYSDGIRHALNEMNSIVEPVASVLLWSNCLRVRNVHHFPVQRKRVVYIGKRRIIDKIQNLSMEKFGKWGIH